MKKVGIILGLIAAVNFVSCRTTHLMKSKIDKSIDSNIVGIVVQCGNQKDTSGITATVIESLKDCKILTLDGFFKNEIYAKDNFDQLFDMDEQFISSQPTLRNLRQILVIKIEYILKRDDVSSKNVYGVTFLGRWMTLSPIAKVHDFYYSERVRASLPEQDIPKVNGFLVGQIHAKICYDVEKFINHLK